MRRHAPYISQDLICLSLDCFDDLEGFYLSFLILWFVLLPG